MTLTCLLRIHMTHHQHHLALPCDGVSDGGWMICEDARNTTEAKMLFLPRQKMNWIQSTFIALMGSFIDFQVTHRPLSPKVTGNKDFSTIHTHYSTHFVVFRARLNYETSFLSSYAG